MSETNDISLAIPADDIEERMADSWRMLLGLGQASIASYDGAEELKSSIVFTLITGFLGAGKTTLLNGLLSEPHGTRLAVIVNDFGSINIDAALIQKTSVSRIDLTNGCVCCTLANGLTATLADLAAQEIPPREIVLEASGIADPHGVVQIALCNPALYFNGIICVVDASTLLENTTSRPIRKTIESQVSAANLILLNKTDIADVTQLEATRSWFSGKNYPGRVVETTFSKIPSALVLDMAEISQLSDFPTYKDHSNSFESFTFESETLIDESRFNALIESFPAEILRAKGIIRLNSDPGRFAVFQVTGNRWSLRKGCDLSESGNTKLVVIGLTGNIDGILLGKRFDECRSK